MLIVDSHAHIYSEDDRVYPPIARSYRPPAGTGTVVHLRRECKAAGVRHILAVQATTYYGWDNRFLVDAGADRRGLGPGVVRGSREDRSGGGSGPAQSGP